MTEEGHEGWHEESPDMTPEEHQALMKKMGIKEEEDREWHKAHGAPQEAPEKSGLRPVNAFAIGGGFLDYCVKQGWLIREGGRRNAKYYLTEEGREAIGKFGIRV